ncbi:hypothetical protein RND71_017933 [Anisodus tanguticus]|uniref:Uncharacterized protein n=1 Tax=Anisodus tanguticus TaxID=243964 RepID=A0AAE1VBL0_9SOLA|nr:hypothetical protein RND71_017933 [Anisodus tanguticus]
MFKEMNRENIHSDQATFASTLRASANLASVSLGKQLHSSVIRLGLMSSVFSGSVLVDMYAKCGSMKDAIEVFKEMPERNIVCWNALISAFAQNGDAEATFSSFMDMIESDLAKKAADQLFQMDALRDGAAYVNMSNIYAEAGNDPGLAVDYPSSNQYKLVTISKLARHSNLFDKFHVLSSDRSGLWREIQLRSNTFSDLAIVSGPVFWLNSLHWLRSDGSVLAFDTNREEAILIERPKFIDHCDFMYGKILTGCDKWLGVAQGLLTLVCIFKKSIIIAAYDNASSNWKVSHTGDNFVSGPYGFINGFPVLIDSERVFFLLERPLTIYHDVYEYDTELNGYRKTAKLHTRVDYPMYCFNPTLASVHETPSEIVDIHYFSFIAAKIDVFRRFITEGTN